MTGNKKTKIITSAVIAAAIFAAAFFGSKTAAYFSSYIFPPSYSKGMNRQIHDENTDITVIQKGRRVSLYKRDTKIWELPRNVLAQRVLLEDIDHDDEKELLILCWKRGRFGKRKPTWVKHDDPRYSQHIYIYEIEDTAVPKWMASDIGIKARTFENRDGMIVITDIYGDVTRWKWISWGLMKM